MTIEIYRKRLVFNHFVVDDVPETVWNDVQCIEIYNKGIKADLNGEELTVNFDHVNYHYVIK